jgi:hypothetical protein
VDQVLTEPPASPAQSSTTPAASPSLYARAHAGTGASVLYALTPQADGQTLQCGAQLADAVIDVATDSAALSVLRQASPGVFTVQALAPTSTSAPALTLPPGPQDTQPALLAVHGATLYVLYRSTTGTADTLEVCQNASPVQCHPSGPATLPAQARSLAVAANGAVYLLLVDGSLGVLAGDALHAANLSLYPALPVSDPDVFNPLTPLPQVPATPTFAAAPTATAGSTSTVPAPTPTSASVTPAAGSTPGGTPAAGSTPGATPSPSATLGPYTPQGVKLLDATLLVSDQQDHLIIADGADHRVIRLDAPSAAASDPLPSQQYADPSALDMLLSISAVSSGQGFALYLLSGQNVLVITLP